MAFKASNTIRPFSRPGTIPSITSCFCNSTAIEKIIIVTTSAGKKCGYVKTIIDITLDIERVSSKTSNATS